MNLKNKWLIPLIVIGLLGSIGFVMFFQTTQLPRFDADRAYRDVVFQENLGSRTPGSEAHQKAGEWIQNELINSGWTVEVQDCSDCSQTVTNIIGKIGTGNEIIILGAHYDSRIYADQDPNPAKQFEPVPGANDGASGVAILLELARILPKPSQKQFWLVFFDAEDNGGINDQEWIYGSRYFVEKLKVQFLPENLPAAAIIVDMVGDQDLNIYYEANSTSVLKEEIWKIANQLGYSQFIPSIKHRMLDDHTPFLEAGIPAVDIIDFDYPYWHTTEDTSDKVSGESLEAVGVTLLHWLTR